MHTRLASTLKSDRMNVPPGLAAAVVPVERMLVDVRSQESLQLALDLCREHLDLVYFPTSIQVELTKRFPESPIRVFCYPSEEEPQYFFMIKDNLYIKPYCMLAHVPDTKFDKIVFIECLREFRLRAFGSLDTNRAHLIIGKENLVKLYSTLMHNLSIQPSNLCLNLFYMDDQQRDAILRHKVSLPVGYIYGQLDADEEAEVVNKTWQHAKDGDLEQTHAKLRRMPSACVRTDSGRPVAFEMVDPAGFMNNQYVYEEHRRKGLGTAVEVQLAQKCIRKGMVPFKTVDKRNFVALNASLNSPFWTMWRDSEGKPVTVVFQEWNPTTTQ